MTRAERNFKPRDETEPPISKAERAINYLIFFVVMALLVMWIVPSIQTLTSGGTSSTVTIRPQPFVEFPSITLCNLEPGIPLRFQSCTQPDGSACHGAVRNDTDEFVCTTFNYDYRDPLSAAAPGLKGLLTIQFGVNTALYPPTSGLFGAQAVLHEPGTVPDLDLSAIFVSPGQATIITLRRTQTRHLPPPKGQGGETLSWDAAPSLLSIDPSIPQASDTIVLGFMYRELAVLDIEEIELSTVTQFLGILAGVIGVLLGLDVLSVSILVVGFAFALVRKRRKRSANVRRAGAGIDEAAGLIGNNGSNNNISSNNNNNNISTNNNSSNNYGHGVGGHNDGGFNGHTTSHGDYGDQPGAGRFIGAGGGGGVELQKQQLQQQQQQYDYGGLQSDHRPGAFSHAPISSPSPPNTHSPFGAGGASRLPPGAPIDERPPLPAIHGSGGSGGGGFRASPQQPYQPHQPLPQYDTDQPNLPGSARDEPGAGDPRVW